MELFALVAAYVLMRVTGHLGPLGTDAGLIVGTGPDGRGRNPGGGKTSPGGSAGGGWRDWVPTGWRPGGDRLAGWWSGLTDQWRDRAHTELDKADWDRDHAHQLTPAGQTDPRGWRTKYRHRRSTCPECGHGGLVAPQASCTCTACPCQYVTLPPAPTPPDGAVPNPTEGDPVSAPTPAPSAPSRPSAPAGTIPPPAWNGAPQSRSQIAPPSQGGVGAAEFNAQDLEAMIVRHAKELQYAHDHMAAGSMPAAITTGLSELNDQSAAYKTVVVRYTAAVREAARNAGGVGQMNIYVDR